VLEGSGAAGALVRGGTLRIAGYVAGVLISVVGASLMIRHLGVVSFGRYATVLSIVTIVGGLSDLGLTGVGTREYTVRAAGERERLLGNLLAMRLALTTAGIGIGCAAGALIGYPAVEVEGIALAGVGLLAVVTQDSLMIPLNASLRLGWTAALDFMRQVGTVAVVVALVLVGGGLLPFTGAQLPAAVLAVAIAVGLLGGPRTLRPRFDMDEWRLLAREVLPYAAASAIGAIYFRVEIVTLSLVAGAVQTGLFSAAFRITEVVAGIPPIVISSALPLLARAAQVDRARLAMVVQRMFEAAIVAAAGIALAEGLGAKLALDVVAGSHFKHSVSVLQIQAATIVFSFPLTIFAFAMLALRRRRAQIVLSAIGLTVAVGASVILAGPYGARGGAIALVAAEAAMAVGFWIALSRIDGMRISLRGLPRVALAAAVAIAVAVVASLPSLWAAVVGEVVFLALLGVSGGLPSEIGHLLPRRLGGQRP
jgi:O-antigen/teichoic acid export membrane protein